MATVLDSELECDGCGTAMKCLCTGPPSMPTIHGSYFCPSLDCPTNAAGVVAEERAR